MAVAFVKVLHGGDVGAGDGLGVGVGVGEGLGVPGVGAGPIVIRPLFCCGEIEFKSLSMNSKSFGNGCQLNGVLCPSVLLTRTQRVLKRTPDPLSGVTPSLTKADTRKVFKRSWTGVQNVRAHGPVNAS